ncbi:hypothetical protein D3C77_709870 [compost metagenome]
MCAIRFTQLDHFVQAIVKAIEERWAFGHHPDDGGEFVTAHMLDALVGAAVGHHPEGDKLP